MKGGAIVHEKYFANSSDTKYETDSAAKTMIAALIGAVHRHRPWDIDRPIVEYGAERREEACMMYCMQCVCCMVWREEKETCPVLYAVLSAVWFVLWCAATPLFNC